MCLWFFEIKMVLRNLIKFIYLNWIRLRNKKNMYVLLKVVVNIMLKMLVCDFEILLYSYFYLYCYCVLLLRCKIF